MTERSNLSESRHFTAKAGRSLTCVVMGQSRFPSCLDLFSNTGQAMRGAGGSRTRFCGFADRRPAVRLRRPRCFDPPSKGNVLARNRTWSPTFAKSCARPSHSKDNHRNRTADQPPTRESNPALRLRRPPCVRHTRGEGAECPCQESNLVFDLRRVACDSGTHQGRDRSRRPGSNRHEPAYKAGASPFGHVGKSRGARI